MRILFVTSELATIFKLGGLADVSYALPVALTKLGIHVDIVMPFYEKIKLHTARCVGQIAVDFDRRRELVFIFRTQIPQTNVSVYLFRHPKLNDYSGHKTAEVFAFFSKTVTELYLYTPHIFGETYDIVHCNDWHTALIPLLLGEHQKVGYQRKHTIQSESTKTVLTIHNLLYQGETGIGTALRLGIPKNLFHVFTTPLGRAVKLLREGLDYADVITTVSPSYAKEMIAGSQGDSIRSILAQRKDRLVGILNGIDEHLWNPHTDPALWETYTLQSVREAKAKNKALLRKALHLQEKRVPLFGFVGRLEARQKGIDLLMQSIRYLPRNAYQLALLGTGTEKIVEKIKILAKDHPNISFIHTFDERLARRIYAGADVMLVPSKFEPCGLTQMIAMRYGTLPLVRNTGGLADSVIDGRDGFVFEKYSEKDLTVSMKKAMETYTNEPSRWHTMIERAMKKDFSWNRSAKEYLKLYKSLLK